MREKTPIIQTERQKIQEKAKKYGLKANMKSEILKKDIAYIEEGKGYKVDESHMKKNNELTFIQKYKYPITLGIMIIIGLLIWGIFGSKN